MLRGKWGLAAAAAALVLMLGSVCLAETQGFGGVAWGTPAKELKHFLKLKTKGAVDYYINLNESFDLKGVDKPVVFYAFVDGRLYAAYVKLENAASFEALRQRLASKYGKPKLKQDGDTVVRRWKKGDVKVKLKSNPVTGTMKAGFYYTPLAESKKVLGRELAPSEFKELMKDYDREIIKFK